MTTVRWRDYRYFPSWTRVMGYADEGKVTTRYSAILPSSLVEKKRERDETVSIANYTSE